MQNEQRSPAWFQARLGKVTASRIDDVVKKTRNGYSAARQNYLLQLVCEHLTATISTNPTSQAMNWGTEHELEARLAYTRITGQDVELAPFVLHPRLPLAGASPDGYVSFDGLIEIKCPYNSANHVMTLAHHEIQSEYMHQMQFQLACTQRDWCDFVSFDPRMPPHLQCYIQRIYRMEDMIRSIEEEVASFIDELQAFLDKLAPMPF